ncbi:MAG: hypothetical protein K2V38_23075, partial [Gemmataceae bacterium]|nr:hypothetical protein [Gemmataceae bacterium]
TGLDPSSAAPFNDRTLARAQKKKHYTERPMPVLPIAHFTWQCLRTVKRAKKPPNGLALRLIPNRKTKDGSFLTEMVELGLLDRVSGTADAPFEATYALTERGEHAAEYGECELPARPRPAKGGAPKAKPKPAPPKKAKKPKPRA